MSSYRSYVPYKSSYTSREDLTGPRYGSISSPSSYRPSFSGGTYRIKRDPIPTYTSRYSTTNIAKEPETKQRPIEAPTNTPKTQPPPSQTKYQANSLNKDASTGFNRYLLSTSGISKYGREPSPAISRIKSREPSPAPNLIRGKSRDPSPAVEIKSKFGNYTSPYRLATRTASNGTFSPKMRTNPTMPKQTVALSYLSSSDLRSRTESRAKERAEKKAQREAEKASKESSETTTDETSEITAEIEPEVFVSIDVVTRATSPTPPGATTVVRTRRIDIAKTIEKTIQRPAKKPQNADKEIQSDKLDDSTRYSRYGLTSRISSYSPHSDRYTPGLRYSSSPLSSKISRETPSRSESDSKKANTVSKSSSRNSIATSKSKSKLSPPKCSSLKSSSLEGNSPPKSLPPSGQKADSSSSSSPSTRWPNKDFRKSALNVGPTDRPRKSRTPSTDSDDKIDRRNIVLNGTTQFLKTVQRSPSTSSESSSEYSSSSTNDVKQSSPNSLKIHTGSHDSPSQNNLPLTNLSTATESSKNNDAKPFLIRKLASVSNFLATRQQDTNSEPIFLDTSSSGNSLSNDSKQNASTTTIPISTTTALPTKNTRSTETPSEMDESSWWLNTSRQIDTESALDIKDELKYKIRHIDSGEKAWWLQNDEDDTLADDLKTLNQEDQSEATDMSSPQNSADSNHNDSAWWQIKNEDDQHCWLDENDTSEVERNNSEEQSLWAENNTADCHSRMSPVHSSWWDNAEESNVQNDSQNSTFDAIKSKVSPEKSAEKSSWCDQNYQHEEQNGSYNQKEQSVISNNLSKTPSSDKPWWNSGPTKKLFNIRHVESGEKAWWMQDEDNEKKSDANTSNSPVNESDDDEDEEIVNVTINRTFREPESDVPPLGDRHSPEGLEAPVKPHSPTPYENIPSSHSANNSRSDSSSQQKLFISRHTHIDELLGGCRPVIDHCFDRNIFLEEITPEQVRIHDSTAQMPYIQRIERDEWDGAAMKRIVPDDATLQVYKDGDFGPYLDLESSLAEQAEDIEGLNSNRKNSLVVRTQLSIRVHAIIEKLLSSEGSELRRSLLSLKQIFQEDKDLVHGFVALGGLNCLVRVGNGADQNYQNCILRALGQVMLYVDGMNGVMKHGPTIQWLYSLIASKYRLVVKIALKLLLVFVEYTESNSNLLVNAIHIVDSTQGTSPWSHIMKLLKDYENADTELLIYATSLINKTLSGLSDQDSFYDESDWLEQQGMEGVIQRYMSRPGTDLDLLDQLQLYEAVLKFEDGEADGIRLPENSVRKTLRYRSSTDSTERRKSRRHSTGTSPMVSKILSPVNRTTPTMNAVLDEDSSSSSNSNEFNNGLFKECNKADRDVTSVTPGLRKRRERAERHKSFMREQQEAHTNGILANLEQREEFGQIVTAIPVHLKNSGDSPPESLQISNENIPSSLALNNDDRISFNPSKLLNSTPISVISNGFERKSSNGGSNFTTPERLTTTGNNRLNGSPEFLASKTIMMKSNATVINGLRKNINRSDNENNTNSITYSSHKKFESDANRLNNYYSQLSTPKNHSIICQKHLNNVDSPHSESEAVTEKSQTQVAPNIILVNNLSLSAIDETDNFKALPKVEEEPVLLTKVVPPPPPPLPPAQPDFTLSTQKQPGHSNPTNNDLALSGSDSSSEEKKLLIQLKRDHTVKDLTQKLTNLPNSPQEDKPTNRTYDMTGLISKAKEGLAKSKSKGELSRSSSVDQEIKKNETKKSENEVHWEELIKSVNRPLNLCDLDFTDLNSDDEKDVLAPRGLGGGIPPPPPPLAIPPPPFAPPPMNMPPPPTNLVPPPMYNFNNSTISRSTNGELSNSSTIKKNKKTVKLFWKEVREDMIPVSVGKTIWDELPEANVDVQKLEHLFESRAKDLITKKQQEINKNKEIIVLDHKRSNAINIAMTKLPPPRAIKAAILKMDATVVTREGIDKLLNMLPTEEERGKIQEAQLSNPELPLGSAEQFLLTLASISELSARLKLWAFKLDFENNEKEIAEPLMDLKQGIELLKQNRTFKCILSTLLSVGIFLNGAPVKGFQIEYLAKVPEVKDTVHKHTLLHHLCHMVMESAADTTDLYSEIGPITRASKADFTELANSLVQLETECKASWDRQRLIAKHDCPPQLKQKLVEFLADCAERIIILQIVHRRVINRYRKFLLWLGVPQHRVAESRPNDFCRILSEFALEYRTTRERVQQQIEKKANHRERNKTRGKMIIDVAKFKSQEDRADDELKQLLGTPTPENINDSLARRRRRAENLRSPIIKQNEDNFTDGDDEILESLVKTATKAPGARSTPRERKRTRHADRKSLRRTLKNGLTEEEKQHVSSLIKTY